MDENRIKIYYIRNICLKRMVIPLSIAKDVVLENVKLQTKKTKLEIARQIANEVGIHGKSFGRTMNEHHKQGR